MMAVLLVLVPVIAGLLSFFIKEEKYVKSFALISTLFVAIIAVVACFLKVDTVLNINAEWIPNLGSRFTLSMDGMSKMLVLLTAISFCFTFGAVKNNKYKNANVFYALMLLTQAGLMGVFLAADALLFYFFWELALIPVYFLCSIWGGERRVQVTFKFFIYTFVGSLLMLVGILLLYIKTPDHSFALQAFYDLKLTAKDQFIAFWLFFIAFAIKVPVFPFHTWQPDTYEQSPTAVTMILSGVMVKMGLYAIIRWVLPVFPLAIDKFGLVIIVFSIIGVIYTSLIAIKQDDIKRLVAYSSIAHLGIMTAAIFTTQQIGLQGAMLQMFNHGINVIGLWIIVDIIERKYGTTKFAQLGGLAQQAPVMAIIFVIMALANIALPLTNAFVGEFLMVNGLFRYNIWVALFAILSIIFVAIYTLGMIQKIFYGNNIVTVTGDVNNNRAGNIVLCTAVIIIFAFGVYPQPILALVNETVITILAQIHSL